MRRTLTITLLLAVALTAGADKKDTLEQLKARVDSTQGKDRIEVMVEIAERQLKTADDAYTAGEVDKAQEAMADVVEYGVRAARDATASGKRMKQTEIALRKIADRLDQIGKSVEVELRPNIVESVRKLEAARNDLLFRMFK